MSVINRMLRDLQTRHAQHATSPTLVSAVNYSSTANKSPVNNYQKLAISLLLVMSAVAGLIAIGWWRFAVQPQPIVSDDSSSLAIDQSNPRAEGIAKSGDQEKNQALIAQAEIPAANKIASAVTDLSAEVIVQDTASAEPETPLIVDAPSGKQANDQSGISAASENTRQLSANTVIADTKSSPILLNSESIDDRFTSKASIDAEAPVITSSMPTVQSFRAPLSDQKPKQARAVVERIDNAYAGSAENYQRGLRELEAGQYTQAENSFTQQLVSDPEHRASMIGLAKARLAMGSNHEVVTMLAPWLQRSPGDSELATLSATASMALGDAQTAANILERTNARTSKNIQTLALLAAAYQQLADHPQASALYQAALQIAPAQGRLWVGYAISLEALDRKTEAVAAYRRSVADTALEPALLAYADNRLRNL